MCKALVYCGLFWSVLGISQENKIEELKQNTICLNMIVKNEKDVILRCLDSVLPIIDTWVIVDTGSSDGTQKIIEDFMRGKQIPGTLYECPWVNFAHNRNEALALAKTRADYILFMDADDYLVLDPDFHLQKTGADFYATISRNSGLDSWIPRLVKASLDWKWEGVVHEYITAPQVQGEPLVGAQYVYTHDGARSKDPQTAMRDLQLLQSDPTPRNVFYTILTYLQMGKNLEALEACKQRIGMQGSEEEQFVAYLIKGNVEKQHKEMQEDAKESFLKAYSLRPYRLESLYYLGERLWEEGSYQKGYELMNLARNIPCDHKDILFVERWIYDYGILMQYALFAAKTQHYVEGLRAIEGVLSREDVSEIHRKDVQNCKEYITGQLQQSVHRKMQEICNVR